MAEDYKSFETERLHVRPTLEADASFIHELLNSPKWKANIGERNVPTIPEARAYIKLRMMEQMSRLGFGNYTVIRKVDQVKLGSIGLYERRGLDVIDVGFAFLERYEGKGYAFESTSALLELGRDYFKLPDVAAITLENNLPSRRLLEKLGLRFERFITLPGDTEELMYYYRSFSSDNT